METFIIENEDRTLANILRYELLENKDVTFAGIHRPDIFEYKIELKIATENNITPKEALLDSIKKLTNKISNLEKEFFTQTII